jgi:hypothetical protein
MLNFIDRIMDQLVSDLGSKPASTESQNSEERPFKKKNSQPQTSFSGLPVHTPQGTRFLLSVPRSFVLLSTTSSDRSTSVVNEIMLL